MNLKTKLYKWWLSFKDILAEFDAAFPETSQNIQLTFIYFFAFVDLVYAVLTNVFTLGYSPEFIQPVMFIIDAILDSPLLKAWGSPEKVFFMSYVVIELMIIRKELNFSKLVKYNVLLIFSLLMVQGLVFSYWDALFNRQISDIIINWAYDGGAVVGTNKSIAISMFLLTFVIFVLLYLYFYRKAILCEFATPPGFVWLTDSVAFWLRIKTPTMRFGKRRKRPKN